MTDGARSDPAAALRDRPATICFDLDGTLCTNTFGEYEAAEPYWWAIERVRALHRDGHRIIILTARGTATGIDWGEVTRGQLERWEVPHAELHFGKPSADVYVDDRAVHTDAWRMGDALGAPGFGPARAASPVLPEVLPPTTPTVLEAGRTFGGRPLGLDSHVAQVLEAAQAAAIRSLPAADDIAGAVCAAIGGAADRDDVVYTVCLAAGGHVAYADAPVPDHGARPYVSVRWLSEATGGLRRFETGPGLDSVQASLDARAPDRWPLGIEGGSAVSLLAGARVAVVRGGNLKVGEGDSSGRVAASWLLDLAEGLGIERVAGMIAPEELAGADEVFLVGTPFCVLAVAGVDDRAIDEAAPGPVTRRLLDAWSAEVGIDIAEQRQRTWASGTGEPA